MTFPAILFLEDGTVYKGLGFGNQSLSVGEIVFNTSMSGYQEIITDPSYENKSLLLLIPISGILELIPKTMNRRIFMLQVL